MPPSDAVNWMREASRFIRAHRHKTFVIYLGGEVLTGPGLEECIEDLVLLAGLGIKLVIVHGARPQIDLACEAQQLIPQFSRDDRITNEAVMACVKQAVATARIELEARLARAVLDTSERNAAIMISGGTFVVARPKGVVAGSDVGLTGEVRRIDIDAIRERLHSGDIVLISPLGYSSSGELFNMNALELATTVAGELNANKLVMLAHSTMKSATGALRQLTLNEARELTLADQSMNRYLDCAIRACHFGVNRVHIVDRTVNGALVEELFTRDGSGTLISDVPFDRLRDATIDDIGGILALIEPLEESGILVKRSREKLEVEIDHFVVMVREGTVVACGAYYLFPPSDMAELACVAVHPSYRGRGFGNAVISLLELRAEKGGAKQKFVLTTGAPKWFEEHGFIRTDIERLPVERQRLYNYQRNSIVLRKV